MRKIILIILIIISLLLGVLLVRGYRENERLTEENKRLTYEIEGYADELGTLRANTDEDWLDQHDNR